jgi:alkylation response protein AidB-like acyl-CoA dehydrogenase
MPSLPPSFPARSQHYGPERGLFGRTITVWLREPDGSVSQRPVIMRLFESNSVDSLYQDVELHDGDVLLGVGKAFNNVYHQFTVGRGWCAWGGGQRW